jgi:RimJ/RimL family protein N-acetyltransferase
VAELRAGVPDDAGALARLWLESAAAGFGQLLPPDYPWPSEEVVERRTRAAMAEEGVVLIVAEGPGGPLGYVGYSASRDPDALTGVGEVRTMFVDPSAWGSGIARTLLARALAGLRDDGYREATVWSFLGNERANAFYEAHGMARDGARRREAVWNEIDEVRYRVALG